MKKLLNKLPRRKKAQDTAEPAGRITNETVAEHREQILAGGRKFKYPVQVAKHRLILTTVILGAVTLTFLVVLIWQQLYVHQALCIELPSCYHLMQPRLMVRVFDIAII